MTSLAEKITVALLILVVIVGVWFLVRVTRAIDIVEAAQASVCLRSGPSGGTDGSCAGYWDDWPDGFHWLREDGTWVH